MSHTCGFTTHTCTTHLHVVCITYVRTSTEAPGQLGSYAQAKATRRPGEPCAAGVTRGDKGPRVCSSSLPSALSQAGTRTAGLWCVLSSRLSWTVGSLPRFPAASPSAAGAESQPAASEHVAKRGMDVLSTACLPFLLSLPNAWLGCQQAR